MDSPLPMNVIAIWVAVYCIIIPLIIAFPKKYKSSKIKNITDVWDKINDVCILIGFIFAILSFGFLYLSSHQFDSCIITNIESSINRTSSIHTIDVNTLEYNLPKNCQSNTDLNRDFDFAVFGIIGLTVPIVSSGLTSIIKKHRKN